MFTFTPLHNYCRSANPAPTLTKPSVAWNFYQSWTLQTRTIMQFALSAKPFREVQGTASKDNKVLILRQYFPMISSHNCGIQFRGWMMLNAITHGFTHVFGQCPKCLHFFYYHIALEGAMVEVEITYKLQLFVRGERVRLFFFVVFSFLAFLANFVYSHLLVAQSHAKLNIEKTFKRLK